MRLIDRIQQLRSTVARFVGPPPLLDEVSATEASAGGQILTPRDEVLRVHGGGDFAVYEKLLDDDQVRPCFRQRRTEIIAREWKVDPGGDAPIDQQAADHLKAQLQRIGWDRTCYKMLAGLMYGYAVGECMFRVGDDGLVQLDKLLVRRSARFCFSATDRALMLKQQGQPTALPARKFWSYSCGAEDDDDPYGTGLGPALYWPVWLKRNGLKFWALFLERFANPTPKAVVPPGTSEAERSKLLKLLAKITDGGQIVVPRGVDIELLQAIRSSTGDFDEFIQRLDRAIAKIILLQTMTTDDGSSYSQSETHYKVLTAGSKADSDLLDESFRLGPATWLTEWNFPGAKVPIIYRDFSASVDLKAIAERDVALNRLGWKPKAKYIAATYGDNYDYVAPGSGAAGPSAVGFAEGPSFADRLSTPDGWQKVMGPEVVKIEQLVSRCRTLPELKRKLGDLALTDPLELVEAMATMMFAARALGQMGGEVDDLDDG